MQRFSPEKRHFTPSFCCRHREVSRLQSPSVMLPVKTKTKAFCDGGRRNYAAVLAFTVVTLNREGSERSTPRSRGVLRDWQQLFAGERLLLSHSGERGRSHRVGRVRKTRGRRQQELRACSLCLEPVCCVSPTPTTTTTRRRHHHHHHLTCMPVVCCW